MRRWSIPGGLACLLIANPLLAQEPELKEFRSEAEGFKVLLPGTPKVADRTTGKLAMKMFTVDLKGKAYLVISLDLPIPSGEDEATTQKRLDGGRDQALKNIKGRLIKERSIRLAGKYLGREIEAAQGDSKLFVIGRFYIVDQRLYQVLVAGEEKAIRTENTRRFLESFSLLK